MSEKKSKHSIASVQSYCESNKDYAKILDMFTNGYTPVYNKLKTKQREEVRSYLKRNFFTWFYSDINEEVTISPARFIASDIYYKFGEDFVAMPIPKPVYNKSKLQGINYVFHIFTMEEHPLINDVQSFLSVMKETGDHEQADFHYGNAHYLIFLFEVCDEMGFIAQDGEEYKINEKKYNAFCALPSKDKLQKMLTAHFSRFLKGFKKQYSYGKLPSVSKLLKVLAVSRDVEDFHKKTFPGIMAKAIDFASSFGLSDLEDMDFYDEDENEVEKIMESTIEMQIILSHITSAAFICLGLYFQLIQIDYDTCFEFGEMDFDYLHSLPPEDSGLDEAETDKYTTLVSYIAYIKPPTLFNLTPIGAKFFGKEFAFEYSRLFIKPEEYDEALGDMLMPF